MGYLKLMKLLYLSEREYLSLYGKTISGDKFVSMPHGPVLSQTYDVICNGSREPSGWGHWITDESNHDVALRGGFERQDLDEINNAVISVMDEIYNQFGHLDRWQLRDYTHDNCPEWEDPHGSSYPIRMRDIFRAVGKSEEEAQKLESRYNEIRDLDRITNQL